MPGCSGELLLGRRLQMMPLELLRVLEWWRSSRNRGPGLTQTYLVACWLCIPSALPFQNFRERVSAKE